MGWCLVGACFKGAALAEPLAQRYQNIVQNKQTGPIPLPLFRELYTESLREGFEPYPKQSKSYIHSLQQGASPKAKLYQGEVNRLRVLQDHYRRANQAPHPETLQKALSYCQQAQLLLCQADMGFRLAQYESLTREQKVELLNQSIIRADEVGHHPLSFVMQAQREYLQRIQQSNHGDHWRSLSVFIEKKAAPERLYASVFAFRLIYGLEELREHKLVCNIGAVFVDPEFTREYVNEAYLGWQYLALAEFAYYKRKWPLALEHLENAQLYHKTTDSELQARISALKAWVLWEQSTGEIPQVQNLLRQANQRFQDTSPERLGRNYLILADLSVHADTKHQYLRAAVSAYLRAKGNVRERFLHEIFTHLKKSALQHETHRLAQGLLRSTNKNTVRIAQQYQVR
jgi:hypothetical protein